MRISVDLDVDKLIANLRDESTKHWERGHKVEATLLDSIAISLEKACIEKEKQD